MNTITTRRQIDLAYTALLIILPVIFYWAVWSICYFLIDNSMVADILMRTIIPRKLLGMPVHLVIFLLTSISLYFSVSAKLKRRTRWYKTPLVSSPKIRPIKSRENKNKSLNLMSHEIIKIYRYSLIGAFMFAHNH